VRVLLDSQVLMTLATEDAPALPPRVRKLLSDPATTRLLSVVTLTEIAIKTSIRKYTSTPETLSQAIADLKLTVLPFTLRHAMRMYDLPLHHREPFDRMIIAVALAESVPLISGDNDFPAYKEQGLSVIWK